MGYKEHLFMDVGCILDKGLELLWHAKSREGEAGRAHVVRDVLEEWEPKNAQEEASRTASRYDNPDEGSELSQLFSQSLIPSVNLFPS